MSDNTSKGKTDRDFLKEERFSASESRLEGNIRQVVNRLMFAMLIIGGSIIASLLFAG